MSDYLKILQNAELQILKDVKAVCEKYNIRFFLNSGTAIGAVRHQGFIPWDDDVDIAMPIDDYRRFLMIAPSELSENYFIQNFETDNHFTMGFTKVRKNGTAMIPPNHTKQKIHHGIWIDIFPIIYIKNDRDFKFKRMMLSVSNYLMMDSFIIDNEVEFKDSLKHAYYPFILFLKLPIRFRRKIKKLILQVVFGASSGEYLSAVYPNLLCKYPTDLFDDVCFIDFEEDKFPMPARFDEYLRIEYGDYMKLPPENERDDHGDLIVSTEQSYELLLEKMNNK